MDIGKDLTLKPEIPLPILTTVPVIVNDSSPDTSIAPAPPDAISEVKKRIKKEKKRIDDLIGWSP